jgi:ribosomal protein L37AE/L43A
MKGWIFGSPNQKQWTQQIYKHKSRFQNPLHQNYKHTKALEASLGLEPDSIFSVIVFIGDSKFKTPMPDNVTHAGGCIRYIKSKQVHMLTDEQVANVIECIESGRLERGFQTNRAHVAHVKQVVADKDNEKVCPKCGSDMVLRESKQGKHAGNKFWGCSTFPKCRSIVNVS